MSEQKLTFKCPQCGGMTFGYRYARNGKLRPMGNTLVEQEDGSFRCVCGHVEEKDFWQKRFEAQPKELSLREASAVLNVDRSTLRRASMEHRLKTFQKENKPNAARYVRLKELIRFYTRQLYHRTDYRTNGKKKEKQK